MLANEIIASTKFPLTIITSYILPYLARYNVTNLNCLCFHNHTDTHKKAQLTIIEEELLNEKNGSKLEQMRVQITCDVVYNPDVHMYMHSHIFQVLIRAQPLPTNTTVIDLTLHNNPLTRCMLCYLCMSDQNLKSRVADDEVLHFRARMIRFLYWLAIKRNQSEEKKSWIDDAGFYTEYEIQPMEIDNAKEKDEVTSWIDDAFLATDKWAKREKQKLLWQKSTDDAMRCVRVYKATYTRRVISVCVLSHKEEEFIQTILHKNRLSKLLIYVASKGDDLLNKWFQNGKQNIYNIICTILQVLFD